MSSAKRLWASRWVQSPTGVRLTCADVALAINCLGYYGSAAVTNVSTAHPLLTSVLDKSVGFSIWAMGPYLSLFGMLGLTYLRIAPKEVPRLLITGWLCLAVAVAAFLFWPTVVDPAFRAQAAGMAAARWPWLPLVQAADTPANCLPSLHAALSAACALAVQRSGNLRASLIWWAWTALIVWSAVSLRQHLSVDLACGALLALVASWAAGHISKRMVWARRLERAVT